MNTLTGELKNVLMGGLVIGPITNPEMYRADEAQRGDPALSMGRSSLMEINHCPHRWINGYNGDTSDAMDWGSLVDCLFLTPNQFKDRYAVQPEHYMTDGMECPVCRSITDSMSCKKCKTQRVPIRIEKKWKSDADECSHWESGQVGKTIIKNKLFQTACDAVRVLNEDKEIKALKDASQCQVMATASYLDEETGIRVPLKILIDLCPAVDSPWGKSLCDLKTTATADMGAWTKQVHKHNLHVQAALYLDVWTACTGEDRVEFRHIVQESYSPYETVLRILSTEYVELGRLKYQDALRKYCKCLKTGIWPSYEARRSFDGWQCVEPEPWMVQ